MTKSDYTAIALVLDRSGSMSFMQADAEGALKEFIADQKRQPGYATLTLVRFDDTYELRHDLRPITEIDGITLEPRGMTALYDAIGYTITQLGERLAAMPEDQRPGKVLVAILTDGQENSSKEWDRAKVFEAITRQSLDYNWEFVYLGANQDAMVESAKIGINPQSAMTFAATGDGVRQASASLSSYASTYRGTGHGKFEE